MNKLWGALLLVGCHTVGPFVKSVSIEGDELVLDTCEIENANGAPSLTGCTTVRRHLPVTHPTYTVMLGSLPTAALATTPEVERLEPGITTRIRTDVVACGARYHVGGVVNVQVSIDNDGRVFSVTLDSRHGAPFANCIAGAFVMSAFPIWIQGAHVTLPFLLPDAPSKTVTSR